MNTCQTCKAENGHRTGCPVVTPAVYEPVPIDLRSKVATEEFGLAKCKTCRDEFIAFSLNRAGDCYRCAGTLPKERAPR